MFLKICDKLLRKQLILSILWIVIAFSYPIYMQTQKIIPKKQNSKPQDVHSNEEIQFYFPPQASGWSTETQISSLREPANVPTVITQEDAKYLEQYMRNYWDGAGNVDQVPVNLASINNRPVQLERSGQANVPIDTPFIVRGSTSSPVNQRETAIQSRVDTSIERRSDFAVKKGKVDDVLFKTSPQVSKYFPYQQQQQQHQHPYPHPHPHPQPLPKKLLDIPANCITRTAPIVARCEDHLIRRLSQDAAEGRTVIDVGRRVCCALFWHKDCINRVVVENCPDSSPVAADFMLGPRKLDLTLSCQRFNRDGCNSAPFGASISYCALILSILMYIIIIGFIKVSFKNV